MLPSNAAKGGSVPSRFGVSFMRAVLFSFLVSLFAGASSLASENYIERVFYQNWTLSLEEDGATVLPVNGFIYTFDFAADTAVYGPEGEQIIGETDGSPIREDDNRGHYSSKQPQEGWFPGHYDMGSLEPFDDPDRPFEVSEVSDDSPPLLEAVEWSPYYLGCNREVRYVDVDLLFSDDPLHGSGALVAISRPGDDPLSSSETKYVPLWLAPRSARIEEKYLSSPWTIIDAAGNASASIIPVEIAGEEESGCGASLGYRVPVDVPFSLRLSSCVLVLWFRSRVWFYSPGAVPAVRRRVLVKGN